MTTSREQASRHPDKPLPSLWQKKGARITSRDYQDISTPSSSFRRRPESSGLDNTFPHGGNDNHSNDNRTRHPINPAVPSPPGLPSWIPAFAGMTTEGRMGLSPPRQPLCHSCRIPDRSPCRHSGLRWHDDVTSRNAPEDYQNVPASFVVIPAQARLHGCRW